MTAEKSSRAAGASEAESTYAWARLLASLALMTLGGAGMYAVAVALPTVQLEFNATRSDASLPYTLTMVGFGLGGIVMGRLSDRYGVMMPVILGAVMLCVGFTAAGNAQSLLQFSLAQGLLIGFLGTAATFVPLVADTSLWFTRRRGIAVAICASGNYMAGAIWPPVLQYYFDTIGWRQTYIGMGVLCALAMLPLALALRRRPPAIAQVAVTSKFAQASARPLGFSPGALQLILCVASLSTCIAMSMPQAHIVAYCGDLGFAAARGAEMLAVMLGFGIISRLASGWICDRIGGLRTLLLGSTLQTVALALFLPFNGLASLYVVSALFGLFQGGIVPSYAIIVREYFTPKEAGERVGLVLMASLLGMALGGWMSGAIYDLTGGYRAAFIHGIAWNLFNMAIVAALLYKVRRGMAPA